MSAAAVVYEADYEAVLEAAVDVYEVDGIPVDVGYQDRHRFGLFSIKEDGDNMDDAAVSDDEEFNGWVAYLCYSTGMTPESFDNYDDMRFRGHP